MLTQQVNLLQSQEAGAGIVSATTTISTVDSSTMTIIPLLSQLLLMKVEQQHSGGTK